MAQYFLLANLSKKEYLHPHGLRSGAKLWEICASNAARVLSYLCATRWKQDRIALIGDYEDEKLFDEVEKNFRNITEEVRGEFNEFITFDQYKV